MDTWLRIATSRHDSAPKKQKSGPNRSQALPNAPAKVPGGASGLNASRSLPVTTHIFGFRPKGQKHQDTKNTIKGSMRTGDLLEVDPAIVDVPILVSGPIAGQLNGLSRL